MSVIGKQSGVVSMGGGTDILNVTISAVADMSKTVALLQVRANGGSSNTMARFGVGCLLTSTTNLRLERYFGEGNALELHWQVIETDNWTVQRGTASLTTNTVNTTISSVTEAEAFNTQFAWGGLFFFPLDGYIVRSIITSTTNLRFDHEFGNTSNFVDWQVIEIPGATVQKGEAASSSTTFHDFTISSVDTAKTMVLSSYRDNGGANVTPDIMRGSRLFDATTVRCSAYSSGSIQNQFYAIESDEFSVQRGTASFSSVTFVDVTISSVDTTKTINHISGPYGSWQTTNRTGVNASDFAFTQVFNSATSIRLQKDSSTYTSSVNWEVVEIADSLPIQAISDYYTRLRQGE